MTVGIELELGLLLALQTLGFAFFGRFEAETAWWRKILKWTIIIALTIILYQNYGHSVTLSILGIVLAISLTVHFWWCKRHGIDPLKALPKRKYYALRQWEWKE